MTAGSASESYGFAGGYPTPETVRRAYDEADLNRAVQPYRFFYPSVSIMATWRGNLRASTRWSCEAGCISWWPPRLLLAGQAIRQPATMSGVHEGGRGSG